MKFPENFLIGASTAAHQVEGYNIHSDYWTMEQMEHSSFCEPSLDAVDHYNRYREDIQLLAEAGLNAYRFSVEWARIEPEPGVFCEKEIAHYRDVLSCCREYGIEPVVTMHHFTSPAWLIEQGGWEAEATVEKFANYCRYVTEHLGDLMNYVCTINEANMGLQIAAISKRYLKLLKEQRTQTEDEAWTAVENSVQIGINMESNSMLERMEMQVAENMQVFGTPQPQVFVGQRTEAGDLLIMRAHKAAVQAMKEVKPTLKIGVTLSLHDIQTLPGGEEKAQQEWEDEFRHYLPFIRDDDFFGLQNYTRTLMDATGSQNPPAGAETTQMGYEYYPQALGHVIRTVHKDLNIPIIVTENGIATADDCRRVAFIEEAMNGVAECIQDNIPVLGYLHWSLLDNFEWQKGYAMTFGLISVDRTSQLRTPKPSLRFLGRYRQE